MNLLLENLSKQEQSKVVDVATIEDDSRYPSKYYIINALGEYTFFRCRERDNAQELCNKMYGKGKYTVRTAIKAIVR